MSSPSHSSCRTSNPRRSTYDLRRHSEVMTTVQQTTRSRRSTSTINKNGSLRQSLRRADAVPPLRNVIAASNEVIGTRNPQEVSHDSTGRTAEKSRKRKIKPRTIPEESTLPTVASPPSPLLPCPFCFEDMAPQYGLSVSAAPCGHVLCTECMNKCNSLFGKCPICGQKIIRKDILRLCLQ